jgi:hypothetical protein
MVEYNIPAMVHVGTSYNPCFHITGTHYLNAGLYVLPDIGSRICQA